MLFGHFQNNHDHMGSPDIKVRLTAFQSYADIALLKLVECCLHRDSVSITSLHNFAPCGIILYQTDRSLNYRHKLRISKQCNVTSIFNDFDMSKTETNTGNWSPVQ